MVRWKHIGLILGGAWGAGLGATFAQPEAAWASLTVALGATLGALFSLRGFAEAPARRIAPLREDDSGHDHLPRALGDALLGRLPDPILILDGQGRVLRANAAADRLFGDNPIDRPLAAFLRAPSLLDAIDAVKAGADLEIVDVTLRVPVERHLEVHVARMMLGKAPGLLLLFHDQTAIKRAERQRADFVANASHELKTPLTVLSGFIETLEGPAREDAVARGRFLTIMREQTTRMGRLVNDLLSLNRIELNEHVSPRDVVDLGALVRDVADGLSMLAAANDMTIEVDLPASYPAIPGEREDLVQAVQNLIDNAMKYGRPGTPIEVSLREVADKRGAERLCLSVRDHGEGIARDHLPRLTERFYRVDAVRSRERGGTGLGLAIVKHIVNRHRGDLTIESVVGEGSCFTLVLPAFAEQRISAPATTPSRMASPMVGVLKTS